MSNIIDKFGIKEVADVTFYKLTPNGRRGEGILTFDTLKTSNIELTAEQSNAKGGKGNGSILIWDHSKDITITLQDALLSDKSLKMLFGDNLDGEDKSITISARNFPGVYWIEGETYARSLSTGKDEIFRFIVPKAKIQSESTLTMEAEGEPSVLDLTLRVLRSSNGEMMKLVKFGIPVVIFTGQIGENIVLTLDDCDTMVVEGEGEVVWSYAGPNTVWPYPKEQATTLKVKGNIDFPAWFFTQEYKLNSVDMGLSTVIDDHLFAACSSLKEVKMSDVTSIGSGAFSNCYSLTSITIPDSVTSIGYSAFHTCTSLTNITIPDSVTYIGQEAFSNCTSLTSITIPDSVTTIGDDAFSNCHNLTGIWVDVNNPSYGNDSYGVLFTKNKTGLIVAPGAISGTYTIPDGVIAIDDYAFSYCSRLTNIIIPDSVFGIGNDAFKGCISLTSITINKPADTIDGAPWGAADTTEIIWNG